MDPANPLHLPLDGSRTAAQRALKRGVGLARASGMCLIVLGAISILLGLLDPLSVGMVISIAVVANGIIEWRAAGRLRALDGSAVDVLAINQIALGGEIGAYAIWRSQTIDVNMIERALRQPMVVTVLELYPPDVVDLMREMLPALIRSGFLFGGVIAVLGCVVMAFYYRSRRKHVARLAMPAAPN